MRVHRVIITCDQEGCDEFFHSHSQTSHDAIRESCDFGWGYTVYDKNYCPTHKIGCIGISNERT